MLKKIYKSTKTYTSSRAFRVIGLILWIFPFVMLVLPRVISAPVGEAYQATLFPVIRVVYDTLLGSWLFPAFYWLLPLWIGWLFFPVKNIRSRRWQSLRRIGLRALLAASWFYWLWGINYLALSPHERLGLAPEKVGVDRLEAAFCRELDAMRQWRPDGGWNTAYDLEDSVRATVSNTLDGMGYRTVGEPRIRALQPEGVLLRFATAGVYMPFAFEGQIDAGLHPIVHPFTMAHEMSHAYGVGHEGSCNFTAFVACLSTGDPHMRYSGHLSYWRYLAREMRFLDPVRYHRLMGEVDPYIFEDLQEIDAYSERYPDIIPLARSFVYDGYLKMQGMEDGLGSYNQIVMWVEQWLGE